VHGHVGRDGAGEQVGVVRLDQQQPARVRPLDVLQRRAAEQHAALIVGRDAEQPDQRFRVAGAAGHDADELAGPHVQVEAVERAVPDAGQAQVARLVGGPVGALGQGEPGVGDQGDPVG
jgi:hypothetical protein